IQDPAQLEALFSTDDPNVIVAALTGDRAPETSAAPATDLAEAFEWTIAYPSGLHARPATRWAETARGFSARAQVRAGDQAADA
ncbi:HPr family phosphocarrier protein, partial [Xanthomonas citri]